MNEKLTLKVILHLTKVKLISKKAIIHEGVSKISKI